VERNLRETFARVSGFGRNSCCLRLTLASTCLLPNLVHNAYMHKSLRHYYPLFLPKKNSSPAERRGPNARARRTSPCTHHWSVHILQQGSYRTGHVAQQHRSTKSDAAVCGEVKLVAVLDIVVAEHGVVRHLATPPEQTYCIIIQAHGPRCVELEQPNVRPRVHFNVK